MSTCPDPSLYSAWADGEVPSPWKEKLEAHIAGCEKCRARTQRYSGLKHLLSETNAPLGAKALEGKALEESFARLSARVNFHMPSPLGKTGSFHKTLKLIHSSVRIPVPALAALFAVAVFIPAWMGLSSGKSEQSNQSSYAAAFPASQEILNGSTTGTTPVYLPQGDSSASSFTMAEYISQFATDKTLFQGAEIVIIKLPDLANFSNTGESLIKQNQELQTNTGFFK